MYQPSHFVEADPAVLLSLMRARPLAVVAVNGEDGPLANHLPLLAVEEEGVLKLRGHVARANPLWRLLEDAPQALAVFQGDDAYISPSWYPGKAEHGKVVPTWNYMVAHARGRLRAVDDPVWLRGLLDQLTRAREAGFPQPWQVADAPADYLDKMLRAIVGIELTVSRLDGKYKLSQNQDEATRLSVRAGLAGSGDERARALAGEMPS
ncbi:FMN-binding negative transcriptional regulator [Pseudogulbenkiania ferrooxidans]|uniref:Transcriptional regulator n=1 Tax=Pseudogulbenkiania ferrooxidans EGD-HP2 TaxID=1388764 RepID=A0ABN0N573_9NEIS|nr:FMN-binding negative transcriptional regulator [Pseudogulbenkiania ferrooxidans]ERE05288.1 transcriptional regulator [Pseudogulbenkiania ferrooxidans EGD-HP2]